MIRFLAGAAACFLLMTGAFLLWQGHAQQGPLLPAAPTQAAATTLASFTPANLQAPEASPKSREEKRFSRADKNKDGKIEEEELLGARRKAFAKLDTNNNGSLSFDEWRRRQSANSRGPTRIAAAS